MRGPINETLLEMHYHHTLIDLAERRYGARVLKLLKPSPNEEQWYGFDQGWVRTHVSEDDIKREIKQSLARSSPQIKELYIGYFLQFKCVHLMRRKSRHCPKGYRIPYYRVSIDTKVNPTTGLSQHQTLYRLGQMPNAKAYYACPMVFHPGIIYEPPNLRNLRVVLVNNAPKDLGDDGLPHHLSFREPNDTKPVWHSDPQDGEAHFGDDLYEREDLVPPLLEPEQALALIRETREVCRQLKDQWLASLDRPPRLPSDDNWGFGWLEGQREARGRREWLPDEKPPVYQHGIPASFCLLKVGIQV